MGIDLEALVLFISAFFISNKHPSGDSYSSLTIFGNLQPSISQISSTS